jgi:hypothetical protein
LEILKNWLNNFSQQNTTTEVKINKHIKPGITIASTPTRNNAGLFLTKVIARAGEARRSAQNNMKRYQSLPLIALFLILMATSAYSLDLNSYKTIKENLPSEKGVTEIWDNYIQFKGSEEKIKLARTLKRDTNENIMGVTDQGFDETTLKVTWLHKPDLIWITWRTYARTDAGYEYDGHIILKINQGQLVELFRHNYDAYWYQGGCTNYRQRLSMTYSEKTSKLKLSMNRHEEKCGTKADLTEYFTKKDITYTWWYRLANSSLHFINGQKIADRKHKSPIEELKTDSYDGLYGIYKELQ